VNFCEYLCWLTLAFVALGGRMVGSWVGRRIGARHAVAWFGALIGFVAITILLEALWGDSLRDWLKDASSACLIYGAIVATFVEVVATVIEFAIQSAKAGDAARPSDESPRIRFRLRSVFVTVLLGSTLFVAYRLGVAPYFRFMKTRDRIQASVRELAQHRPEGVSKRKWSFAVGWTGVAVGNVFFMPSCVNDDQGYYDFADELGRRLQGKVEMSTIDWIWDGFEEIGKNGRSYSERYRPTMPERLRDAEQVPTEIDIP
jgi:hypothetical protein